MEEQGEPILLRNEVEAALMGLLLREQGIPHYIKSYNDRVYDGIFQFQRGWGCIETPQGYACGIRALLSVVRQNKTVPRFE